jgi:membrane-associated phospholipid phosphatase
LHTRKSLPPLLGAVILFACNVAWSQTSVGQDPNAPEATSPAPPATESATPDASGSGLASDIKAYLTAPLRWDRGQWAWFGGALLAIGAAHHYDTQVRTHFVKNLAPGQSINSKDVPDAIPTLAVLGATWAYAALIDDNNGRKEAWTMLEAAGLSTVTTYALKYAIARQGPDRTSNPNQWRKSGGNSFPSYHSAAAFAVGTVLAESGNDDYRWVRRLLGYGLGAATGYERLKHNAHWLSDTVAGAALGIATARFTMSRRDRETEGSSLAIEPVEGGAMLTYRLTLP